MPDGVEVEDLFSASVTLSGGGTGVIAGGSSVPGGGLNENRLIGTKGQMIFGGSSPGAAKVFLTDGAEVAGQQVPAGEWAEVDFSGGETGNARALLIEGFGRWVRGEQEFLAPGDDAVKTLQACESIYRDAGLFPAPAEG